MSLPTVTLKGAAVLPDGTPAIGRQLKLRPLALRVDNPDSKLVLAEWIEITLDSSGLFSISVVPSDVLTPSGIAYEVREDFGKKRHYYVTIPSSVSPIDLFIDLAPADTPPSVPNSYITESALTSAIATAEASEVAARNTAITTAITNLINGAPGALNTLNELATALDDDASFASTVTNQLALKAAITSLAAVALSGQYADLSGLPTLGTAASHAATDFDTPAARASAITALSLGTASTHPDTDFTTPASVSSAVTTAINSLVNGAPGALDTLKKLADAINDDAGFAATVTTALSGKATPANIATAISALSLGTASQHPASDFQLALTDTGALQQWLPSTPSSAGTIWAYNGVIYGRLTTGTDSTFTRANWVELGTDPTVVGGGELASAPLSSTASMAATTTTWVDVTGLAVSPVIPSSGRGIYVDVQGGMTVSVAAVSPIFRLFDVTTNAVALGVSGSALGVIGATCGVINKGYPLVGRWRLAPTAGARTYKVQVQSVGANATVSVLGEDLNFESGIYVTAR